MHKINKQHSADIKIPIIINGRITNSDERNPSVAKDITKHVSGTNFTNCMFKVKIIGNSHLKGSAARKISI